MTEEEFKTLKLGDKIVGNGLPPKNGLIGIKKDFICTVTNISTNRINISPREISVLDSLPDGGTREETRNMSSGLIKTLTLQATEIWKQPNKIISFNKLTYI